MMTGGEVEEEEVDMMVEVIIDVGIEEGMMSQDHRMVGNGPSQMVEEAGTKAIQIETGWTHSNTAVAKVSTLVRQIHGGVLHPPWTLSHPDFFHQGVPLSENPLVPRKNFRAKCPFRPIFAF